MIFSFPHPRFCADLRSRCVLRRATRGQSGFTLIELVTVLIVIGILAVSVASRMDFFAGFDARGFRDQTVSTLRFAQKSALAKRRAVCVVTADTGVTLRIAASDTDNNACDDAALPLPFAPRAGTGLAAATFNFLRLGQTDQSGDVVLTVSGADAITIDAVTGYVR